MSASQRVSRGFHRLAVLSAAIPLLLGIIYSLWSSYQTANNELDRHHKLECAREHAALWPPVILALTAAISLGAYSVIRAIGWVIGRFAAS